MSVEKSYFDKIAEYGQLVIISGPSGVGKSTVITNYIAEHPNACKCVSVTTRPPRADEEDGEDHYFVTHQEFEQLIRSQQLLEYVYRGQNGYGTPKNAVEKLRRAGRNVILDVDVVGATKIRTLCPDATLIFIMPPSWEELERRLRADSTKTEENIRNELETAQEEVLCAGQYDYILINDTVEKTVRRLGQIIHGNRYSRNSMRTFLESYIESELTPQSDLADEILSIHRD
ncbi:guanylate kinase [Allofournierella massiliensis]|uniref:guanylate kinase n=1 Tax=Allofournierella massiliensis TaxID=1650663 RepID=UPI003564CE94